MKNLLILTSFLLAFTVHLNGQKPIFNEINHLLAYGIIPMEVQVTKFLSTDIHQREYNLEGLDKGTIVSLDNDAIGQLLHNRNDFIRLQLPLSESKDIVMVLKRNEIFTSNFSLYTSSGPRTPVTYTPGVHYKGIVEGEASSVVALSVYQDQLMGLIATDEGNFVIGRINNDPENRHIFYNDKDLEKPVEFECGTLDDGLGYTKEQLENISTGRDVSDCVRLYIEVNNDVVVDKGGVVPAIDYVTGLYNQCFILFANESINMMINEILAWTTQSPYHSGNASQKLSSFQANTSFFNADLAQLVGYSADGVAAGFSGICNVNPDLSKCYSGIIFLYHPVPTFSQSVWFVTHELGHLLGSRHTHACVWNGNNTAIDGCAESEGNCPEPPLPPAGTIMSYCMQVTGIDFNLGFGPQPGNVIRNSVNATNNCLTACGPPTTYCLSYGLVSNNKYMKKVVLGSINNTTGNNGGYGNYISHATDLTAGNAYTVSLTPGSNSGTKYWRVWIDYNGDNDWDDAGELAGQGSGTRVVNISFTVPQDASLISTRMRVSMAYNAYAANCGSFPTGEVEDYTVTIQPAQGANPLTATNDIEISQNLIVYPNPAREELNISFDGDIQSLRIVSPNGVTQETVEFNLGKNTIDISHFAPGIYYLRIQSDDQWYQARFIKM